MTTVVRPILALGRLRCRAGLRSAIDLSRSPFVILGAAVGLGILVALHRSADAVRSWSPSAWGTVTAAALMIVGVVVAAAQRGSPIRWQPFDVAWVVTADRGARLLLVEQIYGSALRAGILSAGGSAVSLALQDRRPTGAVVVAIAIASLTLWLRVVSLAAHLVGASNSVASRALEAVGALTAVVAGLAVIAERVVQQRFLPTDTVVRVLVTGVIEPESASVAVLTSTVLVGCLVGAALLPRSEAFVPRAVAASIESAQFREALSGTSRIGPDLGRGLRADLPSWTHWAAAPFACVSVAAWCHHRRTMRYSAVWMSITAGAAGAAAVAPAGWAFVVVALALVLASASVPVGPEAGIIASPTVWLSGISPVTLALSTAAAATLSVATAALPAALVAVLTSGTSTALGVAVVVSIPVVGALLAVAALVTSALVRAPAVRIAVTALVGVLPVLAGVASCALYGTARSPVAVGLALTVPAAAVAVPMTVVLCTVASVSPFARS